MKNDSEPDIDRTHYDIVHNARTLIGMDIFRQGRRNLGKEKMILYNGNSLNIGGATLVPKAAGLPDYTIRVRYTPGITPSSSRWDEVIPVDRENGIWDITIRNANWNYAFFVQHELLEILDANIDNVTSMKYTFESCDNLTSVSLFNTANVTRMDYMFYGCRKLTTVPLFDTRNVTDMGSMFYGCINLTAVPLFNTSKVTYMSSMFHSCHNVQTGALALYQQASTQATPPSSHTDTFYHCGYETTTGLAELNQIPATWGGLLE